MLQVENERSVANTARVFVGIKIAPEIAQVLAQRARFIESHPSRFVPCEDIHLTLLSPWDETCLPETIEKLRAGLTGMTPFTLTFTRLSYWPSPDRPRLLCAECTPTDELKALQSALLSAFGQKNDRPFEPHVTLARMQKGGRGAAGESQTDQELSFVQSVDSVQLFQSPKPPAKGYAILASLPLGAPRSKSRELLRQSLMRVISLGKRLAHLYGSAAKRLRKPASQIQS
jgi:2'-5' RNA ligase